MKLRKVTINQIEINYFNYIPQKGIYLRRDLDIPIRIKKSREKFSIWSNFDNWGGLLGLTVLWIVVIEIVDAIFHVSNWWFYLLFVLLIIGRSFLKRLFISGLISITKKEIQVFSKSILDLQQVKSFSFDSSKTFSLKVVSKSDSFVITFQLQNAKIECYLTNYKDLIKLIDALSDLLNVTIDDTFQNENKEEIIRFW